MIFKLPLASRLIPATLRQDSAQYQRALSVVVFDLAMLFWVPVYVAIFYALGAPLSARIVAATGVLLVANLYVLHRWKSPALCGHALTAVCWSTYMGLTMINGGHNSPPVWWNATVPAYAVVLLGKRGGLAWLLASTTAIAAFFVARVHGWEFPCELSTAGMQFLEFSGLLGLVFCLFMLTFGFKQVEQDAQRSINEALEQTRAADRAKSQFLANMSHEIRTPMTAILGYTELLFERSLDAAAAHDALATIKRNGDHLLTIINDILDLSKIEAGRLVVECNVFSPRQIVNEVVDLLRVRAEARGLRFEVVWTEPLPFEIETDPTRLRQILLNLVGNAIKFTERGSVRLEVSRHAGATPNLRFAVHDTGIGMTEEQLGRLFQPFMQADGSMTRRFGGTGLGLAISRRLAELMGGTIDVTSGPMEGSTFTLTIPVTRTFDAPGSGFACGLTTPSRETHAPIDGDLLAGYRVLLAEDSPDNQRLIRHVVTRAGAEVVVTDNGREACELALSALRDRRPFAVLLMDMQMPILDGYEATRRLREAGYDRPIIALTAHSMGADREKCRIAGCDDYGAKPIDRAQLIALIRRHAEQPASSRNQLVR